MGCGLSPLARGTRQAANCGAMQNAVYPRWRGEHLLESSHCLHDFGLSPLARGTRSAGLESSNSTAVYPRWRGEHVAPSASTVAVSGLSPLARGTHVGTELVERVIRFIPAGAGNTSSCRSYRRRKSVYPRWRGEHYQPVPGAYRCRRFIPAGAGNTGCSLLRMILMPVYPRWRGEHTTSPGRTSRICGLSPLARGTPNPLTRRPDRARFIPAGAGNTHLVG